MRNFLFTLLLFKSVNANAQHSDLFFSVDSIIKNVFHFNGKVVNPIREPHIYIDSTKEIGQGRFFSQSNISQWTTPLILLNGTSVYQDELDCIRKNEIDSLIVYAYPASVAIYGAKGVAGTISILSKHDFKERISTLNNKDLIFTIDSTEIIIDKQVEHKFFWKQLITNDKYFCDKILLPSKIGRKRRIGIYSCITENNSSFQNCYVFEMSISSNYIYSQEELIKEHFKQFQGLRQISLIHFITIDASRTYFLKIEELPVLTI